MSSDPVSEKNNLNLVWIQSVFKSAAKTSYRPESKTQLTAHYLSIHFPFQLSSVFTGYFEPDK